MSEEKEEYTPRFLKASELAKALSVSRALVSKWNKKGLPCFFIGDVKEHKRGARPRYDLAEVRAWLETRTQKGEQA